MTSIEDPISYNGSLITDIPGWSTTGTSVYRYQNRDVSRFDLAQSDKASTTSAFYNGRPINIDGVITLNSRGALDDSISQLKAIFDFSGKTLKLPVSDDQREMYDVTLNNMAVSDVGGGFAAISLELTADDPYTYETTNTELLNELNETSGNQSYPVTVEGTGRQAMTITYTVDSVTDGSSKTVSFIDPDSYTISIDRDWAATEVLVIDTLNETVEVDGVSVAFTGNFPEWRNGARFVNYTDEFTARQVDILVQYKKRYL